MKYTYQLVLYNDRETINETFFSSFKKANDIMDKLVKNWDTLRVDENDHFSYRYVVCGEVTNLSAQLMRRNVL